jgi:diguanylate cyclase (GGDEF)-like protein/PAS domain S-box-containing protein
MIILNHRKFKRNDVMGEKIRLLLLFAICIFILNTKNKYGIAIVFIGIIVLLIFNIIKLKRAQDALQKSEENLQKNYDFLRILLDTVPSPIFSKDAEGKYIDCNTAFEQYLGISKKQIINKTVYEINQGKLSEVFDKADIELMKNREKQTYETKVMYSSGAEHDVLFSKAALISKDNKVQGIVGVMLDITEVKMGEKRISKLLHLNQAMLEVSQAIIDINNIDELFGLILEKAIGIIENAKFGSVLLLDENGVLKIAASRGYDIEAANNFSIPLEQSFQWLKTKGNIEKTIVINDINEIQDINVVNVSKSKDVWDIKSCISAPIIIKNKLYGMVNVDSNYTNAFNEEDLGSMEHLRSQIEIAISKHELYEEIIYLSRYDKLTNIYNRGYFDELFDGRLSEAFKCDEEFLLALFDLNGLKIINDTYGHLAGDIYIKTFINNLINNVRSSDILARYGGDEFVALFPGSDSKKLTIKLEKLAQTLKDNPFIFEGNQIECSFSYGIVSFPKEAQGYHQLVKVADDRMYEYKRAIKE